MFRYFNLCALIFAGAIAFQGIGFADDPKTEKKQAGEETEGEQAEPTFKLKKDVEEAIFPLFERIATAKKSRATIELSAETLSHGTVVDRQTSTYQIATAEPNKFTVYLKQPDQRMRVYCNGKDFIVAVAPDAYFKLEKPMELFDAVFELPIPLGPYPEPVYALTFAGADPALTLLGGMESVEIVERAKFRGKVPSIHFKGVQDDGVVWDFWVTEGKDPKPLRLLVDLTTMLRDNAQMKMREGISYELRFDFLTWRVTGDVDEKLFTYKPPKGAIEYESLEDYYRTLSDVTSNHELMGKKIPDFEATLLSGKKFTAKDFKGKIVVMDFWATWCPPCIESMPILVQACKDAAKKDVVFLAVNVGEKKDKIEEFVKKQGWDINVVLDEDMAISKKFKADVIPLTMVVSKTGITESIHFGFAGNKELEQRLKDEFDVLSVGGRIASATDEDDDKSSASPKSAKGASKPKAKSEARK